MSPRVLVVDDQPLFRKAVIQILREQVDQVVFGEARNADEALKCIKQQDWELVLLDITMPGPKGLELLEAVRAAKPNVAVLVVSTHPEDPYAVEVLRMGAVGYVPKSAEPEELVAAVKHVLSGRKYLSPAVADALISSLASFTPVPLHERLSKRELAVMLALAAGKSVTEIARETELSSKTISTFRGRILRKMNMQTNTELTRYAFRHKLIE